MPFQKIISQPYTCCDGCCCNMLFRLHRTGSVFRSAEHEKECPAQALEGQTIKHQKYKWAEHYSFFLKIVVSVKSG